jgi:hypothetical protein
MKLFEKFVFYEKDTKATEVTLDAERLQRMCLRYLAEEPGMVLTM